MVRLLLFTFAISILATPIVVAAFSQKETPRAIVSDDFTNKRPPSNKRTKGPQKGRRTYRLTSEASTRLEANSGLNPLEVGVTIWKLQLPTGAQSRMDRFQEQSSANHFQWISRRVEADTIFKDGDLLRLSIESPRVGFLYVIDRDWLTDGTAGETNLIFPIRGDDNRLYPGRLIDIPAQDRKPFRANPKPNQAGELLTIIVTSTPLPLPLSSDPLPISSDQLREWNRQWNGATDRFEMNDGAGQARTIEEDQAGSRKGMRQLTREDPAPQTIYLVSPRSSEGFLFNLLLSYVR